MEEDNCDSRGNTDNAVHPEKSSSQGQGDANSDAVSSGDGTSYQIFISNSAVSSGLDNAGKTTIVKKILGEDVNTVSPTLGFIIKTIDYEGYVSHFRVTCRPKKAH